MTTLAEYMIVVGAENHPPVLDKSMYNSWESRMFLYIKGKKNGRMMLESIESGPLVYPAIEENGLPPDVYALVNHFKGESLHEYYLRFTKLINNMHTIGMAMQQVQVNTKFLNTLQPEWSKFVTDVKLVKNMYIANYDQFYNGITFSFSQQPTQNIFQSKKPSYHLRWQGYCSTSSRETRSEFCWCGNYEKCYKLRRNNAAGLARVVKCYNYKVEGHMARQYTKPKRPRNSAWFKEKMFPV
nr:hypothetical protein [Tanacetum cinerariifolium]